MNIKADFRRLSWTHVQPSVVSRISVLVACLVAANGLPQTSIVTNCTEAALRGALAGNGTVSFACDGTITLANTIVISSNQVVDGSGHRVTLSGGNRVRLFYVQTNVTLTLLNLTLANGYSSNGGGVLNDGGTLNLLGTSFRSNSASIPATDPNITVEGGAIFNRGGVVNATNCSFAINTASQPVNTLSQANTVAAPAKGGAVRNEGGEVNLQDCSLVGNHASGSSGTGSTPQNGSAGNGGAIDNAGTLNVAYCRFESNVAQGGTAARWSYWSGVLAGAGSGGAIYSAGQLTVEATLFSNNSAMGGQGIDATNSSYSGASGGAAYGGALCNLGLLAVSDSTFAANSVVGGLGGAGAMGASGLPGGSGGSGGSGGAADGGAMFSGGVAGMWNSTFAFNTAIGGAGGAGGRGGNGSSGAQGGNGGNGGDGGSGFGAVCDTNGMSSFTNCTFASDSGIGGAGGAGGPAGLGLGGAPPPGVAGTNGQAVGGIASGGAFLVNALLASNAPGGNCNGTFSDVGHNLSSDNTPAFTSSSSRNLTDPLLGPLAYNSGATPTMALLPGSPAIDAGDTALAPATDQRGCLRSLGAAADIGAYEFNATGTPSISTPPLSETAEVGDTVHLGVSAFGATPLAYQWFFNSTTTLSGTTGSDLLLPNLQLSQAGSYTVRVTNNFGAANTMPVFLNVIPRVQRSMVPALTITGAPGRVANLDFTPALGAASQWTALDQVTLTQASQWYFDLSGPLPPQGFYRSRRSGLTFPPALRNLNLVPALTLTGAIGNSVRVDWINQVGPIDAWVNLATVALTNNSQLYFDTSVIGQPPRLWRIEPVP